MTKKDYILLARALGRLPDDLPRNRAAAVIADALYDDNAAFDRRRFLVAVDAHAQSEKKGKS